MSSICSRTHNRISIHYISRHRPPNIMNIKSSAPFRFSPFPAFCPYQLWFPRVRPISPKFPITPPTAEQERNPSNNCQSESGIDGFASRRLQMPTSWRWNRAIPITHSNGDRKRNPNSKEESAIEKIENKSCVFVFMLGTMSHSINENEKQGDDG